MAKTKDPTVREAKEQAALDTYHAMLKGYPAVPIEQSPDTEAAADVLRFWCVRLDDGTYRAAVLYAWPGRGGGLVAGKDGDRADVVRWLSESGIPTVKLGTVARKRN